MLYRWEASVGRPVFLFKHFEIYMKPISLLLLFLFSLTATPGFAIVKYEEGAITIDGIQLLQDRENPDFYYYIPPYPRLAMTPEGNFEFLCIKYVGTGGPATNGGLFHALLTFTLSPGETASLEKKLKEKFPKAKLMGVVPMMESIKDGDKSSSSFRLVSSILNNTTGTNPFTVNVITSGSAPFLPGSKAAVAARLNQDGATLLWESFHAGTSDVSVVVDGYFEAAIKGYNAIVQADLELVYQHLSSFKNKQDGFKREQLRSTVDSLCQKGVIKIDVFDRAASLGIKNEDMQSILDLITGKVIEIMFDTKSGWAKVPEMTASAEPTDLKERYENGDFVAFFGGKGEQQYIPDDQYLLKSKKEIRNFKFYLNLSKSTTIKVPVHTAGNIRGFYDLFQEDGRYFKVVNLDDPDFQQRDVFFQLDGGIIDTYADIINQVSVIFRKDYGNGESVTTRELQFLRKDVENGKDIKAVTYPRAGARSADWLQYDYRISWSIKGIDTVITFPAAAEKWLRSDAPVMVLTPPFQRKIVEIDADRTLFKETGTRSCSIRFLSLLLGEPSVPKTVVLRDTDATFTQKVAVYQDKDAPMACQITWYTNKGERKEKTKMLDSDFLFLVPPSE